MLNSMTGFGKAIGTYQGKKISVEIRSLNSKGMDMNVRMAPQYKEIEPEIRKIISDSLGRGKVDFNLNLDSIGDEKNTSINHDLAQSYYQDLKKLNDSLGTETDNYLSLILRMPDVYMTDQQGLTEDEKEWIFSLVEEALAGLNAFRRKEGVELEEEFVDRIRDIRDLLDQIPQFEQQRIDVIEEQPAIDRHAAVFDVAGGRMETRVTDVRGKLPLCPCEPLRDDRASFRPAFGGTIGHFPATWLAVI